MTTIENFRTQPVYTASLLKRILQGALIALILISFFLFKAGEPNPEWGKLWMIRPLIIVPFAGAVGGSFYYFMDGLRSKGNWSKIGANVLSLMVYLIGIWMGAVLGLDGTMWN
ncbi:hypothetical protein [Pedobacter sp.]|uniref:hypothetical protein n=1 Tax=Pedobacter sp. TaxID=1411316 RepID=UPI003D7FDD3F